MAVVLDPVFEPLSKGAPLTILVSELVSSHLSYIVKERKYLETTKITPRKGRPKSKIFNNRTMD